MMAKLAHILDRFHTRIARYDHVRALSPRNFPALPPCNRVAALLLVLFILLAAGAVIGGMVDNKPTTASTGLVGAHRTVTLNMETWFSDGIWWRGKQTPTPLPVTIHGLFFRIFGYSIRGILCLHILAGAVAAGLLYRITTRRYGPGAGLLAMTGYLAAPLPLHVTLSGWTFIWATLFLLLTIDLLDKAVLHKRIPWYLLAGLTLGCAGMSRPENYAVALVVVIFVSIPLRYRLAFLGLTFLYPVAQYLHNNIYLGDDPGLRILSDARDNMGYGALFREWFGSVHRRILNGNFMPAFKWLLIPAVFFFGVPRHRFLTGVLAYFSIAFFAAYAMRRISFNHDGYYFVHVVLAMPFLAALLAWAAQWFIAGARGLAVPQRPARALAVGLLGGVLAGNGYMLRDAYGEYAFYRVPQPVREVRDFLRPRLHPDTRIALDYFAHVSWMIAELEGPRGRDLYYYVVNPTGTPRPRVNAARKDVPPDDQARMNRWVGANYRAWRDAAPPEYLVTQTDAAWARERDRERAMGHYRMYSLRPALGTNQARGSLLDGEVVFSNDEFLIIQRDPTVKNP